MLEYPIESSILEQYGTRPLSCLAMFCSLSAVAWFGVISYLTTLKERVSALGNN